MDIGFLCRLNSLNAVPHTPFLLHRIIPMVKALEKKQHKLLIFSPKHLNIETGMVNGYYLKNNTFVKTMAPIPKRIANYYSGTISAQKRYEITYDAFKRYVEKQKVTVFPSYDFIPFTKNKMTNYDFLYSIDKTLSPQTEQLDSPTKQIQILLKNTDKIFLKPRSGRMGNGIIVITKQKNTYRMTQYNDKKAEQFEYANIDSLLQQAATLTQGRTYLIQQGLNCLTWQQRHFTCRVIMLNDGQTWHCYHMILLAEEKSDVSNTHQGGDICASEKFFQRLLETKDAANVIDNIKAKAYQVIKPLGNRFLKTLYEVAFDFIITTDLKPWIIEINSHPGMSRPHLPQVKTLKDYINLSPDEQARFHRQLDGYGERIVDFLLS